MRSVDNPDGFDPERSSAFRFQHEGHDHVLVSVPLHPPTHRELTPAEVAIARGLVRGLSNAEIARVRGTSVRTVANQVASLLRRLGLDSRSHAALELGAADLTELDEA
jgi:DNA-binding NarL/FixJ family response regulator